MYWEQAGGTIAVGSRQMSSSGGTHRVPCYLRPFHRVHGLRVNLRYLVLNELELAGGREGWGAEGRESKAVEACKVNWGGYKGRKAGPL